MDKQNEWLKKIFQHRPEGFDPYVEKHFETDEGLNYGNWNKYQGQKRIDERSIFPNEIIIDIDADTTEKCREETKKVTTYLDSNGFDHYVADTGGTGFHIHLFFKYKGLDADGYRPYRIALFDYLKNECKEKADAETSLWDEQPVKFDITNSKGHLVRAIGGRKASTKKRKTEVLSTSLNKEEIKDLEKVQYPNRIPWTIQISKTSTDKSDLSIKKINDKVEEIKQKEKQQHDKEVDADFDKKIEGLEDVRNIPASKVLRMINIDFKENQNFECPFHSDNDPSATLYEKDGVERLYCFADSCVEESPPKVWNAVDILIEEGYTFSEALEKLSEAFDVEVQIGYNPHDYFGSGVNSDYQFLPKDMADELLQDFEIISVEKRGLYIWKDNYWQRVRKNEEGPISYEINKRLRNETKSTYRNNVKDILLGEESIKVDQEEFTPPKKMIPFNNGVYDLEEDELKKHKPEYNFTFKYRANYNPEADGNGINQLIKDIAPESSNKRKKIKEILSIAIAPWKVNQTVPIFHGQGANGKNQLVKALFKIVGKKNYHKTDAHSLQTDKFETASLADKQVAFFDEFEDASRPGKLKGIIGDSEQKVREMQKESYNLTTSVYGIFAANELPNPKDNSDGFYRRWEIIDFNQKFTDTENDGNPDKIPPWELEEKYMSQEDLDSFATEMLGHLKDVIERGHIINQSSTEQTRRIWNRKSGNAVYAFIDKYVRQGSFSQDDDEDNFRSNDWIAKEDLKDIVNEYMEFHNNSSIRKDQLTRALKGHPDVDVNCNYRPRTKDGERVTAYGGIRINPDAVRDVNAFSTSSRTRTRGSLQKLNHRNWVDIIDHPPVSKATLYLLGCDNEKSTLFDLVKNVDLKHEDIPLLNTSEVLDVTQEEKGQVSYPVYSINDEKKKELKQKAEKIGSKERKIVEKVKQMNDGGGVSIDDIIEVVELNEKNVEECIDSLLNDGTLYEPNSGKIAVLS